MSKKLTYEFVKEQFEKKKYKLLSEKYKNNSQKLDYICPKGHKHSITWSMWRRGQQCPYCAGNGKPTIEFIRSEFEKEGYTLLTKEYTNNKQKLDCICFKGHKYSVSWSNWCKGRRCPFCVGVNKPTIKFMKAEFAKENYKLLATEYKNNRQKLDYICSEGHKHRMTWSNWVSRCERCPTCKGINMSGSNHPQWKGGIACEPYCPIWLDKEFKKSILERDNYQCQNPDCWGTDNRLMGHHIDYNKKNCDPSNIITVCGSCNSRANKDREYWTKFYQEIMNKKYGYDYGKQKAFFR